MDMIEKIKEWADGINLILAPEKRFTIEKAEYTHDEEFDVYCVSVKVRLTVLYANTIERMCEQTNTRLYGIEPADGGLIILLCDNKTKKG